jgi:hypothetical protein
MTPLERQDALAGTTRFRRWNGRVLPLKRRGSTAAKVGVTPLQALTLGLATARLTQLAVDDSLTEPVRLAVQAKAEPPRKATTLLGTISYQETGPPPLFWDTLDTVLNCSACASVWAAGGVVLASSSGRVGRFLTHVLALSQAALTVKAVIERIER